MDDANLEEVYELINIFGLNSLITSENDLFQKNQVILETNFQAVKSKKF